MAVYAIGDLHLPGSDIKPMDVFGAHWENHFERICEDWRAKRRRYSAAARRFQLGDDAADAMDDSPPRAVGTCPAAR